jgi:hypothetical protein
MARNYNNNNNRKNNNSNVTYLAIFLAVTGLLIDAAEAHVKVPRNPKP